MVPRPPVAPGLEGVPGDKTICFKNITHVHVKGWFWKQNVLKKIARKFFPFSPREKIHRFTQPASDPEENTVHGFNVDMMSNLHSEIPPTQSESFQISHWDKSWTNMGMVLTQIIPQSYLHHVTFSTWGGFWCCWFCGVGDGGFNLKFKLPIDGCSGPIYHRCCISFISPSIWSQIIYPYLSTQSSILTTGKYWTGTRIADARCKDSKFPEPNWVLPQAASN
jgi:hypothetical protein